MTRKRKAVRPGIGMPAALALDDFGALVADAFDGEWPYHVGSSLYSKQWRDVDVRLILDDADYQARGLGDPEHPFSSPKWVAIVRAFASLGRQMTGLPIDFQIQQQTLANKQFGRRTGSARSALGAWHHFREGGPVTPTQAGQ